MRTLFTLMLLFFLVTGCSSVKRNQKFLAQGDYEQVIELSLKKLQKDPYGKNSNAHVSFLEAAFQQAVDEDLRRLQYLKKENNPGNTREIYYLYCDLDRRQEFVRPITALRDIDIQFRDYSTSLVQSKRAFAEYLFNEGNRYLNRNTLYDAREAYSFFRDLKNLQANYPGVDQKLDEAHFKGTRFVSVKLNNFSGQIIPFQLERDLLDFNTYGINDFWTEYHAKPSQGIRYDMGIDLNFRQIQVSPERIYEKEYQRTKVINDGWEYVKDRYGNIVKDSLGNAIKVDKNITVTATIRYTEQQKAVQVGAFAVYKDLNSHQVLNQYPINTEFVFENIFARYQGDKRALTEEDLEYIKYDFFPFPSGQQMVFDAGNDIKERLKEILRNHRF